MELEPEVRDRVLAMDPWTAVSFFYDTVACLQCERLGRCDHRELEVVFAIVERERVRHVAYLEQLAALERVRKPVRRERASAREAARAARI